MAFDFPSSPAVGQVYAPAGGPSWTWDGTAWKSGLSAQGTRAPTRTIFTAPGGPFPYTIPIGCTEYEVEVLGGGGGGGNTAGGSVVGSSVAGAGGGAGGYAKKLIPVTDAIRAATKNIYVPNGGVGNGGGGSAQYTDGVNVLTATGGGSGGQGAWNTNAIIVNGGAPGVGSGGDINVTGAGGEIGLSMGSVVCGTGLAVALPGNGGTSIYGGGARGVGLSASGAASYNNGVNGGGYGAGGSGASAANAAAANATGGTGSQGIVIITEYYSGEAAAAPGPVPAGHCYLDYDVPGVTMRLSRQNGRHLFINGVNEVIPAAGVALAATGLLAGSLYLYAYMNSGVMTLEANTTAPATDATYGHRVKTGDPSRTFVGVHYMQTNGTWSGIDTCTASMYNPKLKSSTFGNVSPTSSSASYVELGTVLRGMFASIADRESRFSYQCTAYTSLNTADVYTTVGIDGPSGLLPTVRTARNSISGGSSQMPVNVTGGYTPSEGGHFFTPIGAPSAGSTATWASSWTEVTIFG